MTSIARVAERAGVSITTVSRVLNNSSHPVGEEVRKRVLKAAKALNYSPSALARAMVTKSTRIIGVIVGDVADPYFATVVRSIADAARLQGYLTITCNSDRVPDIELNFARLLRDYRADGIIFAGGGLTNASYLAEIEGILSWFEARQTPVIVLGHHLFDRPQVNIDNNQATRDMTSYLIDLGHQRIGYIKGPSGLTTSKLRLQGYQQALTDHGVSFDPALIIDGDFTYESGERAAEQLLNCPDKPTAIFASNDVAAIGCMASLKERGINIPGQMTVVGFDNIPSTRYVDPRLTTVDVPMRAMGAEGVRQIIRVINLESVERLHLLPHRLIIRGSSGPPQGS
jgi:LacI family transcriptional regulator